MVGMVSPCILDVVHVWYCLIGSLVIMHGLVTSALAGLIVQTHCAQFLVSHTLVACVCLLWTSFIYQACPGCL